MEIIDELEPTTRSAYTGSIGYLSFHETMDLNIAIRTMIIKENDVYFQVGGGIVADSDPSEEYEETIHKARAMMESLKACEMRLV
jgi:para-aminobenzoate synthetase component 1